MGSTLRNGGDDGWGGDPSGGGGDGDDHESALIMIDKNLGVGDRNWRVDTSSCISHSGRKCKTGFNPYTRCRMGEATNCYLEESTDIWHFLIVSYTRLAAEVIDGFHPPLTLKFS